MEVAARMLSEGALVWKVVRERRPDGQKHPLNQSLRHGSGQASISPWKGGKKDGPQMERSVCRCATAAVIGDTQPFYVLASMLRP